MSSASTTGESSLPSKSPRGYCWIPTMTLEPGMVIARPVAAESAAHAAILLATGSTITASTISQLINKGVECVAVFQETPPDAAAHAEQVARFESRLNEIFGEHPDKNCRVLLDALIADGPCQC